MRMWLPPFSWGPPVPGPVLNEKDAGPDIELCV